MKQVKVAFLFFIILFFLSCKKEVFKENNSSQKTSEVQNTYQSSAYKKLKYQEKLQVSKKILLEASLNSADRYMIFNNISYLYGKLNKIDSSIYYSKEMLQLDHVKNNDQYLGNINYKLGGYFIKKDQRDSAFYYYNRSKEYFLNRKDSIYVGRCFLNIAYIESNFGSYSKSDSCAVASIKFINKKRKITTASAYNILAINSKNRFLYNDAISYYLKSIDISNSQRSKIIYKNNLANVYKELKNYSKSILILEDLLKDSIKDLKTKARIIDNLADVKWLKNPEEPILKELLMAKSIRIAQKDNYGLLASYSHLSDFFNRKDKMKSLVYAEKMYETSKKLSRPKDQIEAITKILALQTPQKSIKYYKESIRLRDSLQKTEIKRQYKFAKIKYNFEEEEKEKQKFKTLSIESRWIAEQEINQKKNLLIVGVLLVLGLLFLMYKRKQQHKKGILQETYTTEIRIAKKLHDELGNDIFKTLTKIQSTKFKTQDIIHDLDKIYMQARSISHENDSIETGNNFENYFRDLVASYNSDDCKITLKDLADLNLNELEQEKQVVFYRVFNELFVNMKKHSKASLVVISCKKIKNYLEVVYADNGVGFKDEKIIFKNGLINMETRTKTIKGLIIFENRITGGLKVVFSFKK
ncbi:MULTISPECIES: sensor histidine kinase [unclassified Polaribacter]|uniref:sensor histidine kinase n=1 Tax=unclassified Polaribacter TaxID=196858 RepID=UPI0011BE33D6|nr:MULTISPECIES: hypothetical protein [unclassified Polaribacter]TXD53110.1 hypothetical protein ES043_05285 [Polaribacter sp. IC063]TXD61230.1 hypothetical protein ES044_05255 [Polaribacter sp. IC066]